MEDYVIPTLKEKLPNNSFIAGLTFGLKTDPTTGKERGFFKPIINMMQIDNTQKTKAIYEQMLHDFNDLNKISIAEIDNQNPVNLFYLYNLIILILIFLFEMINFVFLYHLNISSYFLFL